MKIIEMIVSPTGETKIETKGFSGSSCQAASEFLEKALGKVLLDKPTAEIHRLRESGHIRHHN